MMLGKITAAYLLLKYSILNNSNNISNNCVISNANLQQILFGFPKKKKKIMNYLFPSRLNYGNIFKYLLIGY